jgi:3'-phosphoadenosine 5'-phosphosulfate sulfotransferase (PAPS reductase)/FAD synthetase
MNKTRHVLGLSGGKDSAALAIYLKESSKFPNIEYYFSDTGCELPETYEFLDRLEIHLGQKIVRIGSQAPFGHHLILNGNMLPSPGQRWCTVKMKLEPFERFIGNDKAISYIAIRADEHREGYISTKPNIKPVFPFVHDGIVRKDVFQTLAKTVGVPEYYKWRSRSGCYFCFFQKREEWLGLYDHHPELFKKAMALEKVDPKGNGYTWIEGMTLEELLEKRNSIIKFAENRRKNEDNRTWQEMLLEQGDDPDDQGCLICSL